MSVHGPANRDIGPIRSVFWVLATIIGLAVGGFAFHFPGSNDSGWESSALVFGTLIGGVNGLFVGFLQMLVLRGVVAHPGRIPWTTGVIVGATHGAYDFAPANDLGLVLPVGAGLVAAIAVAVVGRERRGPVLGAVAVSWAAGLWLSAITTSALGMPWSETPVGWSMEHLVQGVVVAIVFGLTVALVGVPTSSRRPDPAILGAA